MLQEKIRSSPKGLLFTRVIWHFAAVLLWFPLVSGCAALGFTLLGVGAGVTTGTAVTYTLNGYAYRTVTASMPRVEKATHAALDRMAIKVGAIEKTDIGKIIRASGNGREIEVELEAVSANSTQIRDQPGVFVPVTMLTIVAQAPWSQAV